MLKIFFTFIILSSSLLAHADTHVGRIHSIDLARTQGEETHLYIDDGYVLKIPPQDKQSLEVYQEFMEEGKIVKFRIDENRTIISSEEVDVPDEDEVTSGLSIQEDYAPSVLSSTEEAQRIFNSMRKGATSWSQCYNRAHVWAYESKKSFNLDSMKMFLFFTRKYIREYNFEWWFHVSPFTYVMEEGNRTEKILDFKFSKGPTNVQKWTDLFMSNRALCPVITKYSEYENNEEQEYCYLYKASMYYLQPLDLDNLERTGTAKSQWLKYEVRRAYRNGFGVWL
ncbi:MAG: protein-glutamine glutaminase family protein [Bacteriovoracia bacterium]